MPALRSLRPKVANSLIALGSLETETLEALTSGAPDIPLISLRSNRSLETLCASRQPLDSLWALRAFS